ALRGHNRGFLISKLPPFRTGRPFAGSSTWERGRWSRLGQCDLAQVEHVGELVSREKGSLADPGHHVAVLTPVGRTAESQQLVGGLVRPRIADGDQHHRAGTIE